MNSTVHDRYGTRRRRSPWRAFLKPGWIVSALIIVVFSYFAFTLLAPWQLNKDSDIVERNERIAEAFDHDPLPVGEVFDHGALGDTGEWRRVSLTGRYLPEAEAVLRMRPSDSGPAVQVLTAFAATDGTTYLINRGYEPTTGADVPPYNPAPEGEVSIVGVARLGEAPPERASFTEDGHLQVYGINTELIGQDLGTPLARDYVQLSEGQPGEVTAMPIPQLDRGSHLSYGLQWIAFGIMAPLGLGYFVYAEVRERRRARSEQEELAAAPADAAPQDRPTPPGPERRSRREERKHFQEALWDDDSPQRPAHPRDRYGR
ncbi:SURF1 family cytochrome oxidase biogenesis protein [Corynebacterium mastitidis]